MGFGGFHEQGNRAYGPGLYLCAKLNIGGNDRNLDHGDEANQADHAQEPKYVVVSTFVLPETAENEQKFNEDNGEGNEACKEDCIDALRIP